MSHHIPVEKICEKLKKKDSQICELKYGELPAAGAVPVPSGVQVIWGHAACCSCSVLHSMVRSLA